MTDSEKCGAKCRDGTPCESWSVTGGSRCRMHGGSTPTKDENPDVGPPDGAVNNPDGPDPDHGVRATPANLLDKLDADDREFVIGLHEKFLGLAAFDADDPRSERLRMTCVMMWQEWSARHEITADGLTVTETVGVTEDGRPIESADSHYLLKEAASLNRQIRQNLKDIGLLDDPESQKADALGDLAGGAELVFDAGGD